MKSEHRLRANKDFQKVFQQGNSTANRQFVVYQRKDVKQKNFRFGLSVSKKIGNAVTRNRIKRYVRETFRELEMQIRTGKDYVIIARRPTANMNYHEVKQSLIHVLRRASALTSGSQKKS